MTFKAFLARLVGKGAKPLGDPFSECDRFPGVRKLDPDAEDELERRREINADGAARRAERARVWNELLRDKPSWLGRRPGWLRPKSREWPRRGW